MRVITTFSNKVTSQFFSVFCCTRISTVDCKTWMSIFVRKIKVKAINTKVSWRDVANSFSVTPICWNMQDLPKLNTRRKKVKNHLSNWFCCINYVKNIQANISEFLINCQKIIKFVYLSVRPETLSMTISLFSKFVTDWKLFIF